MEFGAKEILIALGVLVLIAIILDVVKRIRASRYENIRMPRRKQPVFEDDDFDEFGSELPSGGGRVVSYREEEPEDTCQPAIVSESNSPQPQPEADVAEEPETVVAEPSQASLDLESEAAVTSNPVAVIHLMAQSGMPFDGVLLKDAFLAAGLRYGSMKIFHRHQEASGSGPILFSVANSVNPGTFDLNDMESFSSPGVTLFFSFDEVDNPLKTFDVMLDTAQQLSDELNGELKDETRSVLTRQTVEHYRQKITDYQRARLAGAR